VVVALGIQHASRMRRITQEGAEETHVFHIRITLFIFNIKKFQLHKKEGILMHF